MTRRVADPAEAGRLVAAVLAAQGDLRANAVLSLAVEELTLHVRTLARRLFVDERAAIRETVIACGVPETEVEDVMATCLVAAWAAIQRGQFRVYAHAAPAETLRRWLHGVSWRLAMHERNRAHHRREVLSRDPWALATTQPVLDLQDQIAARAGLRALWAVPRKCRNLLLAVASGTTPSKLAQRFGVSARNVRREIDRARRDLQEQIAEGYAGGVRRWMLAVRPRG